MRSICTERLNVCDKETASLRMKMRISTFLHMNLKDVISHHILQATSQFFSSNRRWGFSVRGYIVAVSFPWALRGEDASSISKLA